MFKKPIHILLILAATYFLLHGTGMDLRAGEHVTRSGKSLFIEESHPLGQSISNIHLNSSGFEHELSEILEDRDPIKNVLIAVLDQNGFDEFYIFTISSGSGSYGNLIAFASNRDKSLSMIHFPEIEEGDERFSGYMGHDHFQISDNVLVRSFPIYLPPDNNNKPTGGRREVFYGLFPGEASWQLKIVDSATIR